MAADPWTSPDPEAARHLHRKYRPQFVDELLDIFPMLTPSGIVVDESVPLGPSAYPDPEMQAHVKPGDPGLGTAARRQLASTLPMSRDAITDLTILPFNSDKQMADLDRLLFKKKYSRGANTNRRDFYTKGRGMTQRMGKHGNIELVSLYDTRKPALYAPNAANIAPDMLTASLYRRLSRSPEAWAKYVELLDPDLATGKSFMRNTYDPLAEYLWGQASEFEDARVFADPEELSSKGLRDVIRRNDAFRGHHGDESVTYRLPGRGQLDDVVDMGIPVARPDEIAPQMQRGMRNNNTIGRFLQQVKHLKGGARFLPVAAGLAGGAALINHLVGQDSSKPRSVG